MKKFFIILAAAALFAACEKEETPKEPLPEPKFSETTVMAEQKTLNINSTITDFTFVSQDATAVGVWYAAVDKEEKTEAAGTFKDGKISGSFKNLAYGEYAAGVYAEVEGKKYYSEADYACVIEHAKIDGYKTIEIAGKTWMGENLRFVPQGKTVSDNAAKGSIWYPADAGKGAALKDEAAVKQFGLLYDHLTALGISNRKVENLVKANEAEKLEAYIKSFEGVQGICPEGWHVPTAVECVSAFGKGAGTIKTDANAPFYNKTLDCGSLTLAEAAGYNFQFAGNVFDAGFAATGVYKKDVISGSKEEWNGKNKVTYQMSSTIYKVNISKENIITNVQFYNLMSNFAPKYVSEGGFSLLFNGIGSGITLRCVKNDVK